MSNTQQVDKGALKAQALLEKIANMTAQYENQVADLRVELTVVQQQLSDLEAATEEVEKKVKAK